MTEKGILNGIMVLATRLGNRMFRNNVGTGYQGIPFFPRNTTSVIVNKGDVVLRKYRITRYGLCKFSSDLIGFTTKTITPDMVGQTVAIFTACEIKVGADRLSTGQKAFIKMVQTGGGLAGVAKSKEDYERIL